MAFFVLFIQDLDASLQSLTADFRTATAEKISCQEEVTRTTQTIELANRLVKGLMVNKGRSRHLVAALGQSWHKINCQFAGGMEGRVLVIELHQ